MAPVPDSPIALVAADSPARRLAHSLPAPAGVIQRLARSGRQADRPAGGRMDRGRPRLRPGRRPRGRALRRDRERRAVPPRRRSGVTPSSSPSTTSSRSRTAGAWRPSAAIRPARRWSSTTLPRATASAASSIHVADRGRRRLPRALVAGRHGLRRQTKRLSLPPGWLMAGFRRNDLTDIAGRPLPFRSRPRRRTPQGLARATASVDWSRREIYGRDGGRCLGRRRRARGPRSRSGARRRRASPRHRRPCKRRADVVNDLRDWLARMRYAIQLGFENRADVLASCRCPGTRPIEVFQPELAVRLAALGGLAEAQVIATAGICPAARDRRGA